ncbi:hypothetical protein [Anaerotignum sp.]|nr:hypothetical protein [Anaerotignum sp.]MBQ7758388.1 hypothetical protein [Anaerotignum sp.]
MEKIVRVEEYEFPVRSSAATLLSYRRNFGRDGMKDLLALVKGLGKKKITPVDENDTETEEERKHEMMIAFADSSFEMDTLYRFIWTFAKSADKTIPPLEEWLDTFDVPALEFVADVFPQVSDLLFSMAKTNVKAKKK